MFSFSWSEIALIVVVALIAIGPKDLPGALKTVAQLVKKARGMAGEFQTHVNELMREADLEDVRKHIDEIRNFDIKGTVEKAIDPDQSIRKTFTEDPFAAADAAAATPSQEAAAVADGETAVLERPAADEELASADGAPVAPPEPEASEPEAPSFVPPAVVAATRHPPSFIPPDMLSTRS
jgi:sec-independent protein translocase protein TatB